MEINDAFRGKEKQWAKLIAQAWADEGFKKRLLADPKSVLKENGIEFPEHIKLSMVEGKENEINLTIPPKPVSVVGNEEILPERIAAMMYCSVGACVP